MAEFFLNNFGQVIQAVGVLVMIGIMFQTLRGDLKNQGGRLEKVENELSEMRKVVVALARQEERYNAMDQRMLAQGQRIDSTAAILNGRMEAINNIVAGHTAKLDNLSRVRG